MAHYLDKNNDPATEKRLFDIDSYSLPGLSIYLPDILKKQTRVHGTLGITEFRISDFQTFIFESHGPEVPSKRR